MVRLLRKYGPIVWVREDHALTECWLDSYVSSFSLQLDDYGSDLVICVYIYTYIYE